MLTVAGPTFCDGPVETVRGSGEVGALAVDPSGTVWAEVGEARTGTLAKIGLDGRVEILQTGLGRIPGRRVDFAPDRIASDRRGGVFLAAGDRVLHVNRGISRVLHSSGSPGGKAESQHSKTADFEGAGNVATDSSGNLFVSERLSDGSARVRFLNAGAENTVLFKDTPGQLIVPPGSAQTIVGWGRWATNAAVVGASESGGITSIAVGPGRLYLGISGEPRSATKTAKIVMINMGFAEPTAHGTSIEIGRAKSIAGGLAGFKGDGGPATEARFSTRMGLGADETGNLVVADQGNNRIRLINDQGIVTTVAGMRQPLSGGYNGNGLPGKKTRLNRPLDADFGPGGRIYFSDQRNQQVRYVDVSGRVAPAAGTNLSVSARCPQSNSSVPAGKPIALSSAPNGSVYFAAEVPAVAGRISPDGEVSSVAGTAFPQVCANERCRPEGGQALRVSLRRPSGIATHGRKGIYLFDESRVKYVNLDNEEAKLHGVAIPAGGIKTVAGNGEAPAPGGTEPSRGRALDTPLGPTGAIAADRKGNLFIADYGSGSVRLVDPKGAIFSILARSNEPAPTECCALPTGLTTDTAGNLYVSDRLAFRIWFLNRGRQSILIHGQHVPPGMNLAIAGNGRSGFGGDGGPALQAQFSSPRGLAVDKHRNLYVADDIDHTVRQIDANGAITTVAGTGSAGFNGDALKGPLTFLNEPKDVAVDDCGNVLIVDQGNSRIRRLSNGYC